MVAGAGAFLALGSRHANRRGDPRDRNHVGGGELRPIAGGILVFGDPVGNDPLDVVARCLAFVAVIMAVALMPAPRRPAHASA